VGWGFAPDPTGGAYCAAPNPLEVFRGLGLLHKRGEGMGEEREERDGGSSLFALGRKVKSVPVVLQTAADDQCDKLAVDRRKYYQLS